MGDRGSVTIKSDKSGRIDHELHLFTHWRGSDLEALVAMGLNRSRDRWLEADALARIVFESVTEDDEEPGGGGFRFSDTEYDTKKQIVIDPKYETVYVRNNYGRTEYDFGFEEFITKFLEEED